MKYLLGFFSFLILSAVAFLFFMYIQIRSEAYEIINYRPPLASKVYDKNGNLVANLFDVENRVYVEYEDIPARLKEAFVAIEDTSYFEHGGVNFEAVTRAAIENIKAMGIVEGGSTLTQQLVKNSVLTNEKTFIRKLKEFFLSLEVERALSKEEILERYLNEIYFGHGYYGIETASVGYFHKNLDDLTLKEIAILAGLPKAPSSYDPTKHFELSLGRANLVLDRMYSLGWIEKSEYESAIKSRPVVYDDTLTQNKAPYVIDEVIKIAKKDFPDIKTGGYKIYLTIDMDIQELSRESLIYGYNRIKDRNIDLDLSKLNGAIVVLENTTGNILALVGGVDYYKSNFNRATQIQRQTGSSFKPFIYQIALDYGYSPLSFIPDISRVYGTNSNDNKETTLWKPRNYERNYQGLITLKSALSHSRNLATLNLVEDVGFNNIYNSLEKFGFRNMPYNLSLSLGTVSLSPLDYSMFYTIFSNYGTKVKPILIKKIVSRDGDVKKYSAKYTKITSPSQAFLLNTMLVDATTSGTSKNANVKNIQLAGKTGTTNNNIDAWFCGFSPQIQTIVWYGNDNNTPMGPRETGGVTAAPVFKYFYQKYLKLHPETKREFYVPQGVKKSVIDGKTEYFTDVSKLPKKQELNDNMLVF